LTRLNGTNTKWDLADLCALKNNGPCPFICPTGLH
jgi:hypothetical protein